MNIKEYQEYKTKPFRKKDFSKHKHVEKCNES